METTPHSAPAEEFEDVISGQAMARDIELIDDGHDGLLTAEAIQLDDQRFGGLVQAPRRLKNIRRNVRTWQPA